MLLLSVRLEQGSGKRENKNKLNELSFPIYTVMVKEMNRVNDFDILDMYISFPAIGAVSLPYMAMFLAILRNIPTTYSSWCVQEVYKHCHCRLQILGFWIKSNSLTG